MNRFGVTLADVRAAVFVVNAFWPALAAEDLPRVQRCLRAELRGSASGVLAAIGLRPRDAAYIGTSDLARVLDDGSLLILGFPTAHGAPVVLRAGSSATGWGVRLERLGIGWLIAGINDVGDRRVVDWLDIPADALGQPITATPGAH
jgi:hypothetical protein